MPKLREENRTLRQQLEEHLGWTVAVILVPVIVGTAAITWQVADNVFLKIKDNEIAELKRQLVELNKQLTKSAPTVGAESTPLPSKSTASPPSTPPTTEELGITFEQFEQKFADLHGNPSQERQLIYAFANQRIRWKVRVASVNSNGNEIIIVFARLDGGFSEFISSAFFDDTFRKKVLKVTQGAVVIFEGVLQASVDGTRLLVRCDAIELDKPPAK